MNDIQQSTIIEYLPPESLKPHPKNVQIYGEDGYKDLVDSIRELGVMQAVYITPERTIISGHRRWYAAREAGISTIPAITVSFTSELDERRAIIEHNRYRIKNGQQLWNEGKELEAIEAEEAELQRRAKISAHRSGEMVENLPPSEKTRDIVAKTIGLGSGKQWDKLDYVAGHKPDLLHEIKPGGISIHKAWNEVKRDERLANASKPQPFPTGKYSVIYADPPWQYDNSGFSSSAAGQYPTMSIQELDALDVSGICEDSCIIFLWATNPFLREALHLLYNWGFSYKTNIAWVKHSPMMGHYVRSQHELLLIGTKGTGLEPYGEKPASVLIADRGKHSQKPEQVYEMIEAMYPNATKVELFARNTKEGWDSWGNQLENQSTRK